MAEGRRVIERGWFVATFGAAAGGGAEVVAAFGAEVVTAAVSISHKVNGGNGRKYGSQDHDRPMGDENCPRACGGIAKHELCLGIPGIGADVAEAHPLASRAAPAAGGFGKISLELNPSIGNYVRRIPGIGNGIDLNAASDARARGPDHGGGIGGNREGPEPDSAAIAVDGIAHGVGGIPEAIAGVVAADPEGDGGEANEGGERREDFEEAGLHLGIDA